MKGIQRNLYPGGNTPQGFYSYYNYIISQNKAEKIFCIKGGPGLGKSTFMRNIGEYFLGKGEAVDFLWCSSDTESIDGILLQDRKVAMIDGTAPHIVDPITPGAVDEIINLGEFWNEKKLRNAKNDILCSMSIIKNMFEMAYNYLSCAASHYSFMSTVLEQLIDEKVIIETVDNIINICRADSKKRQLGIRKKSFISAITPGGMRNGLESILHNIDTIIILEAPVGFRTEAVMKPAADVLIRSGFDIEEYYCPMDPEKKLEHILVPDMKTAIMSFNKYHSADNIRIAKKYNIDAAWKNNGIITEVYSEQLEEADKNMMKAVRMLKCAKAHHDVLEKYYMGAMDFSRIDELKDNIIKKIEKIEG